MTVLEHCSGEPAAGRDTALMEDHILPHDLMGVSVLFIFAVLFLFFCRSLAWGGVEISSSVQVGNPYYSNTEAHEITGPHSWEGRSSLGEPVEDGHSLKMAGLQDSPEELLPDKDLEEQVQGDDDWMDEEDPESPLPDPLEPMNRAFYHFNDKLYFWLLKPVGIGYETVVPLVARVSIRNFFSNLMMPVRAVSCLLQGKFTGVGIELTRFMVNTSAGFFGLLDVAKIALDMPLQDEDLGQTLAFYGIGPGFYLTLPLLGPTTLRGAVGWGGQIFLNPLNYFFEDWYPYLFVRSFEIVNNTSLRIGEYEALKDASLDPYIAMRNAYYQYRLSQIEK